MSSDDTLPDYAPELSDYHRAFRKELRAMIAGLPIRPGNRVLEVASGDGAYLNWLAEMAGTGRGVTALDVSSAFLELARKSAARSDVAFVSASLEKMPFADDSFDLVWCAQSLYSLPDPVEALRNMARVVRPGGTVAVLENDTLHHILLPWPVEVELAVRRAELTAFIGESPRPRKFYVARNLRTFFREAGLESCRLHTVATNRTAPLGPHERGFFEKHVANLRDRARPHLEPSMREWFDMLTDPASGVFILDAPDLTVTCLDHLATGLKPE